MAESSAVGRVENKKKKGKGKVQRLGRGSERGVRGPDSVRRKKIDCELVM